MTNMHAREKASNSIAKEGLNICWPFLVVGFLFFWWSKDHPFFWDTVLLGSKIAHFYYDNQFQSLILPLQLDAGHPPFFGAYIAMWWTCLGKSLWVSHLAMLPITLGIIWQVYRLCRYFFDHHVEIRWAMLILLTDATLLAQCSLVSPDVVLVFASLWAVNSVLYRQSFPCREAQ